jgi:ankyrin repeat protein
MASALYTQLLQAVKYGNALEAKHLITQGAYNKPTLDDWCKHGSHTPLHWAAMKGDLPMVKILAEIEPDINIGGDNKQRPLHCVAMAGESPDHLEVVDFLIERGAEVDEEDCHGYIPLHFAVSSKYSGMVSHLIKHKASPHTPCHSAFSTPDRETPLGWATYKYRNDEIRRMMNA